MKLNSFNKILLSVFVLSLFIFNNLVNFMIAAVLLGVIVQLIKGKRLKNIFSIETLISSSVFLISVIGIIYTQKKNLNVGSFDIEVKLTLVLCALFILHFPFKNELVRVVKKALIYGGVVAFTFCLCIALKNSISFTENQLVFDSSAADWIRDYSEIEKLVAGYSYFSGQFFVNILDHHSYVGMYVALALCFCYEMFINKIQRLKWGILCFCLVVFIVLMQSRANLLVLIVLLIMGARKYFNEKVKSSMKLVLFAAFVILGWGIVSKTRLSKNFNLDIVLNYQKAKKENIRLAIWEIAVDLVKKDLILGVGTGDIKTELRKEYEKLNLQGAIDKDLNVHNQYLETAVGQGLVGLAVLLFWLIYPFVLAYKRKDYVFMGFLIIVAVNFMFESMLNRFAGVVFIAFFYNFFLSAYVKPKENDQEKVALT